jgi:hypothetical protein
MRPEVVRTQRRISPPELRSPVTIIPVFGSPRPQALGRQVQRMLTGEADRPMHLMCYRSGDPDGAIGAKLGSCDLELRVTSARSTACGKRGAVHRRCLVGEQCKRVLDSLELADRPAELTAIVRMLNG